MSRTSDRLTVLIPVDFSPPSRLAMAWAFDYAQRAPCDLHMVHVVDRHPRLADFSAPSTAQIEDELAPILAAAKEELAAMAQDEDQREAVGSVVQHLAYGSPTKEIVLLARNLAADLIVMGTHGRTGVERIMGSVAAKVVREAPCTVVCVKQTVGAT